MLQLENLRIGYQKGKAEKCLAASFSVSAGAGRIALMGLNGSGKSTLLRVIAGMEKPLSGRVLLNGTDLAKLSVKKRATLVSMVFSQPPATGNFTVSEILSFGRMPYHSVFSFIKEEANAKKIIDKYVSLFELHSFLKQPFHELSDGEKQRVMMARAFVQETPLILLDEPTAHLDVLHKRKVYHWLQSVHEQEPHKLILFSSHHPELALEAANQIWVLHNATFEQYLPSGFKTGSALAALIWPDQIPGV